jgi:hypothetical protein
VEVHATRLHLLSKTEHLLGDDLVVSPVLLLSKRHFAVLAREHIFNLLQGEDFTAAEDE